jgi:alpha-soluble NSF attachment protein
MISGRISITSSYQAGNFRQAADREKEVCPLISPLTRLISDCWDLRTRWTRRWESQGLIRKSRRLVQARRRQCVCFSNPNIEKELMDSTANQCYQQAAELSGDLGEYHRAMELYQTVADWSLTSALTKYSVKEYWLRAALCSMAMGVSLLSLWIFQC